MYFNPRSHEGSDLLCLFFLHSGHKFQSTLPRGERLQVCSVIPAPSQFQSTLPRGERLLRYDIAASCVSFQSTLPRGERQNKITILAMRRYFNPRSHEGSDGHWISEPTKIGEFQSTLPRGERRKEDTQGSGRTPISIHAPTRGATVLEVAKYPVKPISIHAPTRGATTPRVRVQKIRPHISIHAPTRGATMIRRRRASDGEFQSTLPRGERPGSNC